MEDRWATFDCYGTLIDWNGGIGGELARLFGAERAPRLLERYHELEPQVEAEHHRSYRQVLQLTLERLAGVEALALSDDERGSLARSLADWQAFPDVRPALEELRKDGWRLAILSNTDPDLIAASQARIGVPFDETVTAADAGSYKPAHGHWHEFARRARPAPGCHVHVAASAFHDVEPASTLGVPTVWINRLGEAAPAVTPTRELPDLADLLRTLEELVPR